MSLQTPTMIRAIQRKLCRKAIFQLWQHTRADGKLAPDKGRHHAGAGCAVRDET
jgi:hypothetical protein